MVEARIDKIFEDIVATIREPLLVLDSNLKVILANKMFINFFKVKPEETVGQLIYDLGDKQWDIPKLRDLLETILPEKTTFDNYEVEHDFTTIGRRTMLLNARQIQRAMGMERIILLAIEDITERREIEDGLEKTRKELAIIKKIADEAHEFAESIINTVREPLIALDQDLRVVSVSRAFYNFFKVKPEETVGQLIYDLGDKQWDIPKLRDLLETILPEKTTFDNYEVEHDFTTIGRRTMLLNARQIQRAMGMERIILLAIEDITERKEVEEELKETNQNLEELLYIAAHDLQSPLISMEGFASDILNNYRNKLDKQGVHQLERIKVNAQRMHTLVLSLLDISRLNIKKNPFITFSADKVIQKVLSDLSLIIEKADVKVKTGKMPKVLGDKTKIEVVFRNLVTNAVTYGGKNIELGFKGGVFFVKDDGIGIDKNQLEKIFNPGERLKDIKTDGVGMGLTFCRKVIKQHGGKLWAESDGEGKGATFYFEVKTKR